jgi:enoyl-CoA hydratase/carnithine racemase
MTPVTTYDVDRQGVALLRLDRPEARNAINTQMLEELIGHVSGARDDEAVRVLVLSSSDHMGFSAGADVREELDQDERVRRMELFGQVYTELTGFPKATVAVCHGSCVGGGAEIAVACDLRVGGSNLRLRFPGAALGVPVGPARLVSLCGLSVAKYLLLTSKEVGADEALRWGLVHKVAPAPATEGAALQLAAQVAENPGAATLKRMLHEWDAVEDRTRAEAETIVKWQRSAPGLGEYTPEG